MPLVLARRAFLHNDHCMPSRKAEPVLGFDLDGTRADF
jgi:hypothetical protein